MRSGTPVLASRIAGNVGMLGADYAGYFEPDDAEGLAALLQRCRDEAAILLRHAAARNARARARAVRAGARARARLLAALLARDSLETSR